MKKLALIVLSLALASGASFADEPATKADHPCRKIEDACKAAGFVRGGHKGEEKKGIFVDCMKPIMAGQSVAGVTVNPAELKACQAKREKRKAARESKAAAKAE